MTHGCLQDLKFILVARCEALKRWRDIHEHKEIDTEFRSNLFSVMTHAVAP
jgi:hypothetical protein